MSVLVTGGAGFIGSHTVEKLLQQGRRVVCLDNFNDFYAPARKRANLRSALQHPNFTLVEGDIRDPELVEAVFTRERPSQVLHLAAMAGVRPSIAHPGLYEEVNVRGTLNLLEAAVRQGVPQMVFASSSSIYGATAEVPFREDARTDNPVSPYAATKKAGELLGYVFHHVHGLAFTGLRFFTAYGPRGRPDMAVYRFTAAVRQGRPLELYGDGSARRDFTFVDDIVAGTVAALDRPQPYAIVNLGNAHTVTVRELIELVGEACGRTPEIEVHPPQPGDVPVTSADISRARELLGFEPRTALPDGLTRFVQWYEDEVEGHRG